MSLGRRLLEDDASTLVNEWRSLRTIYDSDDEINANSSCSIAKKYPCKNRYADVLALDSTRVKLLPTEDNPDGYINANVIKLASSRTISTQGPLPETFEEFWRMVWVSRCFNGIENTEN